MTGPAPVIAAEPRPAGSAWCRQRAVNSLELSASPAPSSAATTPAQRYTAVRDVDARRWPTGEFVSVVGPTGCGKSTLLNVAAGLLAPSAGQVRVFGEPLAGINRAPATCSRPRA